MKSCKIILICILTAWLLVSCSPSEGDAPGHEYMPDMFHSTAYEANLLDYYKFNTWGGTEDYMKYAMPRTPVKGTIPRGYAGMSMSDDPKAVAQHFVGLPMSGSVPYYYEDSDAERERAMAEIVENPYPITAAGLSSGKELYEIFCATCHGENGDGLGYLVRDDGGMYPAQPANFLLPEFVEASEGRYYHSIIYGKNVMGGYADKLSYEERWNVIHYIRGLQAKELKLAYDENENTLNSVGVPYATIAHLDQDHDHDESEAHDHDGEHHSDEEHGHDHDHGHGDAHH
ncbi:MAG: c-type cytochrome [Saprospiraceae bacterium]|nr:c-type cytochrome [Saprospiraceae bacterium]